MCKTYDFQCFHNQASSFTSKSPEEKKQIFVDPYKNRGKLNYMQIYQHCAVIKIYYTVPKIINFPRYNMKCSGENVILLGIVYVVSRFPLHFMLYRAKFGVLFQQCRQRAIFLQYPVQVLQNKKFTRPLKHILFLLLHLQKPYFYFLAKCPKT